MNDISKKIEGKKSPLGLGLVVDELATVKAEIAELKKTEEGLKADLIEAAECAGLSNTVIEGKLFRASISLCEGRETIDWQAIAMKFKPSRQLIAAHTSQGEPYTRVLVSAKKTS